MYWSWPELSFQKARNFTTISIVVTRMQDLASEFSKIFRGNIPGPSQREVATPYRTQHPAGAGRKHPGVGTQTLNFLAVVVPLQMSSPRWVS